MKLVMTWRGLRFKREHKFTEYERRCLRDGTVWYVPQALHDEPKGATRAERFSASGERLMAVGGHGSSAHSTRVGAKMMAQATQMAAYQAAQRCPTCGSMAFTEHSVTVKR